jgi:site-specific recombinase XerD
MVSPRAWFELVMLEAIKKNSSLQDVTWHIFRHTYISRLVMAGVDLRTVQELAGHKDIKMTVRYAHLAPAHKLAAVDKLAEYRLKQEKAESTETPSISSVAA